MLLESQRDKTQGDANEFCQGQIISQSRLAENHLISVFLPSVSYYPRPTKQSTDVEDSFTVLTGLQSSLVSGPISCAEPGLARDPL